MKDLNNNIRIILSVALIGLIFLPVIVLASDVTGALYRGTIQATNSSNSTVENISGNFTLSTPDLMTAGQLNNNADNCAIRDDSGSDTAFMPGYGTNPWILFCESVLASVSKNAYLYIGDVTGGKIRWFPGSTGGIVTDNDSLEWGATGNFTFSGFFDPTSTGYLLKKGSVLFAQGNGSGNVTLTAYTPAVSDNYSESIGGGNHCVYAGNAVYLTARNAAAGTVLYPNGYMGQQLSAGTYYLYRAPLLFTIPAFPMGANITSAKLHLWGADDQSVTDFNITVTNGMPLYPSNPLVLADYDRTKYSGNGGSLTTAGLVVGGDNILNLNSTGKGWIPMAGGTVKFMLFSDRDISATAPVGDEYVTFTLGASSKLEITYDTSGTVSTSVISADEHTFMTYLAGGFLGIKVDDNAAVETAWTNNIMPNSDNWTLCTNGILTYVEYIEAQQSDVQTGYWEWEYGATFPDDSSHGNTMTPSFRTISSDANVSTVLVSYLPIEQAVVESGMVDSWPTMITAAPDQPTTMYTENNTPGIFFAPLINTLMNAAGLPASLFWYNFCFATILIAGIATFYFMAAKNQNGLMLKCIVMTVLMIFWALPGPNVYGMYVVIYFIMWCFGANVLARNYGW